MAEIRKGEFQAGAFVVPLPPSQPAPLTLPASSGNRIASLDPDPAQDADGMSREWHTRGGRIWVATVLPLLIGILGATSIVGGIYALVGRGRGGAAEPDPAVFLLLLAGLVGWLVWKVAGTVWRVRLFGSDHIVCTAAARTWQLGPGEVLAVRGNAYGLLLVIVTSTNRIWLWDLMNDRRGLLSAIRRLSPAAKFDRYVCPSHH